MTAGPEGDLEGVTVVALEQAVAAPLATMRLADAGARVIKIERSEGDFARSYDRLVKGQSAYFVWLNRGKESLCLDLNNSADRKLLLKIIAGADIFVQNLKPGTLGRWGLSPERLAERFPALIICSISGFGSKGERAGLKAYDLIVQGEAGLCSITGGAEEPSRAGISVCDIAAGEAAHAAILRALLGRAKTGRGRVIEISLFDALADWMNVPLLQFRYGSFEAPRCGVRHATIAPYGAFACADGAQLIVAVQNEREWRAFCTGVLGDAMLAKEARFAGNDARVANRDALDRTIAGHFERLSIDQAERQLINSGIAFGRLNSIAEAAAHPQLRLIAVATPAGNIEVAAPAMPGLAARPVPAIGEHDEAIRREFGFPRTRPGNTASLDLNFPRL